MTSDCVDIGLVPITFLDHLRILLEIDYAVALLNQISKLQGGTVDGRRVLFSFQLSDELGTDVRIAR